MCAKQYTVPSQPYLLLYICANELFCVKKTAPATVNKKKKALLLVAAVVFAPIHIHGLLPMVSMDEAIGLATHHLELAAGRIF